MKQFLSFFFAITISMPCHADLVAGHADLATLFKKLDIHSKGPFAQNVLQGTEDLAYVINGDQPKGTFLFQAAYRNETAVLLAEQENFYTGNLFTTNYYELMGEYVFGNPHGSHPLDHQGLVNQSAKAFPKAASMIRHWVLEKYYVEHLPDSKIARSFAFRGISDAQNEQEFARYFFNFYLSSFNNDLPQFLPAYLLVKDTPLGGLTALNKARDLIATAYDDAALSQGSDNPMVKQLYLIRNMVHNQLSPDVVVAIDKFIKAYPQENTSKLLEVRKILIDYYSSSATEIANRAQKLGSSQAKALADALVKNGATISALLELSNIVADLRTNIGVASVIPYEKKTDALVLVAGTTQYLNKEVSTKDLTSLKPAEIIALLQIALNSIYMEGFLIKDNWQEFAQEMRSTSDVKKVAESLQEAIGVTSETVTQAFTPALAQWILVEPKMQPFVDNTLKSSAVNTAALIIAKIKR
jgi:hypothetical protein